MSSDRPRRRRPRATRSTSPASPSAAWAAPTPRAAGTENIVALCDVDDESMARLLRNEELEPAEKAMYEKAAKYRDFRRMLEKEKGIDAVTVVDPRSQPRRHRHGRHQAGQARLRPEAARPIRSRRPASWPRRPRKPTSCTQMGNQGHAGEGARLVCEWIWGGAIGNVTEVHCWTNRPDLAPGRRRAGRDPVRARDARLGRLARPGPLPALPSRLPSLQVARAGWDFGTGALGDMGAHIMDQPFWALKLKSPTSVQALVHRLHQGLLPPGPRS
ncbi:MAG: hypothetical protein MZV64_34005 [Ignavibacteriales bacterium]|nr:hypothetical protein [Ignavibacteriales bacterium]